MVCVCVLKIIYMYSCVLYIHIKQLLELLEYKKSWGRNWGSPDTWKQRIALGKFPIFNAFHLRAAPVSTVFRVTVVTGWGGVKILERREIPLFFMFTLSKYLVDL